MDIYDREVARLTEEPELIRESWNNWTPLFQYISPNGRSQFEETHCGCPTMIRNGTRNAFTPELTSIIRDDERLPKCEDDITPAHLPVFAEVQRLADKLLNRTPPEETR